MSEKQIMYEARNGKKYKITASHFLGNIADCFGYLFTIHQAEREFQFVIRLPRRIALGKWKLPNRAEEEKVLVLLGQALVKRELDLGNEKDGSQITLTDELARESVPKTIESLK